MSRAVEFGCSVLGIAAGAIASMGAVDPCMGSGQSCAYVGNFKVLAGVTSVGLLTYAIYTSHKQEEEEMQIEGEQMKLTTYENLRDQLFMQKQLEADEVSIEEQILGRLGISQPMNAIAPSATPAINIPGVPMAVPQFALPSPQPAQKMSQAIPLGVGVNDAIAIEPTQQSKPLPTNAAELMQRLFEECPEFLKLVESPPIRLVGVQRTGKSTFARKLALLRAIAIPGHKIAWSTPHLESDNPLAKELNYFGFTENGKDFKSIESAWEAVQKNGLDKGKQLNLTAVWDEFGGYDAFYDPDLLGNSLKALLREASKHRYYPILIAHGDAVNFYPGVKDILKVLQGGTVLVETIGEPVGALGRMRPTGKVKITWLDGNQQQIKVPDWLTEELLLSLQPANTKSEIIERAIARNTFTDPYAAQRSPVSTYPTRPIIADDTDWHEDVRRWLYLQPARPNDGDLRGKCQELTGKVLNETGLALLKQNLNLP